jgi:LmbE family N-acetylglucosaminyl deacetylase
MSRPVAFAITAHPDDIEFMMAGTLALLGQAGCELHMMNLADGSCGSVTEDGPTTAARRWEEAQGAARTLGATIHPPLAPDLELTYSVPLLRRLAAVMREVQPTILLLHSPQDYMEDHMVTARLAVTAAFSRGMRNFATDPPRPTTGQDVTLYHALPYGLCDGLRQRILPELFVDITSVLPLKRQALACHRSQKEWLDHSQGLDSYLATMEDMSREVGRWSGTFEYAEGWRRHSHLGFCAESADPLYEALSEFAGGPVSSRAVNEPN